MAPKRLTTILITAVLATVFSGCGNDSEESDVQAPPSAAEETPSSAPEQSVETIEAEPSTGEATEETTTEDSSETSEAAPSSEEAAPTSGDGPAPSDDELPTTVEEYAEAYLAAGMNGDQEMLERMGTDEAVRASVTWTELDWSGGSVREGLSEGEVFVSYVGTGHRDNVYGLSLRIDRAAAEAGEDDAVLAGETGNAMPEHTPEEYADEMLRYWQAGEGYHRPHVTSEVARTLEGEPTDGTWERSEATEDGEDVLLTYTNAETGRELVLTVSVPVVEARAEQAVIGAEFRG